jgi:hypothetical protein
MAGSEDGRELPASEEIRLTAEVVARLDAKYESTQDVAGRVWAEVQTHIEQFTRLEIAMFCAEYLGQIAIGSFPNRPEFKQSVVEVAQFLYAGYYGGLIITEREESDVRDERGQDQGDDTVSGAIDT